jgi:hypothetical protein
MLAELGDHLLEVNLTFDGQDADGVPITFELTGVETVVLNPPGTRLDLSASNGREQDQIESISLISIGESAYLYLPQVGCISGDIDDFGDDMRLPVDPRLILENMTEADLVANDVIVNGQRTTEFRLDETSLPWSLANPWSVSGSAFVEADSNVIVQATMTLSGRGDLMGDGRVLEGTYDILIDVTEDVGDEATILPAACGESARYPLAPDAYEITTIDDLLSYKSSLPLEEIVAFYMVEMPVAGYESVAEPDIFEDLAIMNFAQGEARLMIAAEYDADANVVSVLISP